MKKILVTDDEPNILKVVSARLKNFGYEVVTAGDGEEARQKARETHPDLVLLDIMLPKIDGLTLCKEFKSDPKFSNLIVVLFSAKAKSDYKEKMEDLGADGYITKPFQPLELQAVLAELLKETR
jgi:DNA-binding response OmpR family regulator